MPHLCGKYYYSLFDITFVITNNDDWSESASEIMFYIMQPVIAVDCNVCHFNPMIAQLMTHWPLIMQLYDVLALNNFNMLVPSNIVVVF